MRKSDRCGPLARVFFPQLARIVHSIKIASEKTGLERGIVVDKNQFVILDFLDRIGPADSGDQMFSILESVILDLGFEHVSYTFVPELLIRSLTRVSPVFKLSKNYNTGFIDHYAEANFGEHDFTIRRIIEGEPNPIVWWNDARDKRLSPEEKQIIEVAREDYGLRHGVTLSAYCDGASMAGVSLTSGDKDHAFDLLLKEKINVVQQLSRLFNDHLFRKPEYQIIFLMPVLKKLSKTELAVLLGLSKGKNIQKIADELERSDKYINNVVVSKLKNKLNCLSRDQLMYQAGKIKIDQIIDALGHNNLINL